MDAMDVILAKMTHTGSEFSSGHADLLRDSFLILDVIIANVRQHAAPGQAASREIVYYRLGHRNQPGTARQEDYFRL